MCSQALSDLFYTAPVGSGILRALAGLFQQTADLDCRSTRHRGSARKTGRQLLDAMTQEMKMAGADSVGAEAVSGSHRKRQLHGEKVLFFLGPFGKEAPFFPESIAKGSSGKSFEH